MKTEMRMFLCLLALLFLAGCGIQTSGEEELPELTTAPTLANQQPQETQTAEDTASSGTIPALSELFSQRDYETDYEESQAAVIQLSGSTAQCDSDAVEISGSTVTILEEGTYVLSGTLDDGMVMVNGENTDKIQLVLDGASIHSETSAAIYVAQADKVFLTLADGTENTLSNGGQFVSVDENNIDAVIFSKDDLTINGSGALTIASPAGHGVVSKDDLVITGGTYTVTAEGQGFSGKDSVCVADGVLTVTAGKDGIHAENTDDTSLGYVYLAGGTYDITAQGDGISASGDLQIADGTFTLQTGGGSGTVTQDSEGGWDWNRPDQQQTETAEDTVSAKGIKAEGNLLVEGGTFQLDTADDGLHSGADLTVKGGTWDISTGDDGLHADEDATISDGTLTVATSYEGIEGRNIFISGGTIDVTASDDGLNAAGGNDGSGSGGFGGFRDKGGFEETSDSTIEISGGSIRINASGDGIDSNGSLTVTGGETYVSGPTNSGNGFLDYGGEATITGGIFLAAGTSGMAQNFGTASTQGAMLVNVSASEGDAIVLTDSSGSQLLSWTAEKSFQCILVSCPELKQGETYTLFAGEGGQNITMDSLIYGETGMGRDPGGMKGQSDGQPPERKGGPGGSGDMEMPRP